MGDFAGWLALTLLNQRIQHEVSVLYLRAVMENFNALFDLQYYFQNFFYSMSKIG